jgi:hypothetical protein
VVLTGRRPQPLHDLAAELGERAVAVPADAASAAGMAAVAETAATRFGGISTLVANAGGPGSGTAADVTDEAWALSLRVNLTTCLVTARACLPGLIRRRGSVVVISSIAGLAVPRMCLILSENWTMTSGRDLPALVRWAREAEDAGFDAVMISEHVVLGPAAAARGVMANPREYALPGNQDPATPWPSSLVLLAAIAAVTQRVRLVASAVIAPLRHPAAARPRAGHPRPGQRRPPGRAAHRVLAGRRVRRAGRAVPPAWRPARRAPGRVGRAVA